MELQKLYVTLMLDAADFKTGMAAVTGAVGIAVAATTAAVAKVAIDGVNAAKDMEAQMSNIAAVFGKTTDEIAPLGGLIKDLGLDPGLKVDAVQAADAIEMLARNGLSMGEIMDGAAKATVLLANSTGAEFATAANIGTDAMAIFGIEAQDMLTAVDGITAVTTNSKFSINDYALALAQGGGVAAASGVEFNDFNTAIAGISPLFKSGSDAGTSFKTFLTRLNPTTDAALGKMIELGIATKDGSSVFYDAAGNLESMENIAGTLKYAMSGLTEEQRSSAMQTIFGTDAMRAAAGMMELGQEGFRNLSETMSQTDALAAAATRMDNLSGAMEIFEGIVDTVVLSIGQALLPVIRMFIDWLIVMAEMWMPKIEAAIGLLVVAIEEFFRSLETGQGIIAAVMEVLDNFLPEETIMRIWDFIDVLDMLWGKFIELVTPIATAISQFVSWKDILIAVAISIAATVIPILISLAATILTIVAPILIIIAAVALLRNAWEQNWFGIRDITAAVFLEITTFIETFRANWDTNWAEAQTIVQSAWSFIQSIINAVLSVIGPAIETFTENARTSLSKFDTLLPALAELWKALKPIVVLVLQTIGAALVIMLGVAVGVFNGIANAIGPFIDAFIAMSAALLKVFTGIAEFIMAFLELIAGMFAQNNEVVEESWAKLGEALSKIVTGIVEFMIAAITGLYETVIALVEGLVEGVIEFFTNLANELVGNSIIPDMLDAIIEVFAAGWAKVAEDIRAIDWVGLGKSIVNGIISGLSSRASALMNKARSLAKQAWTAMANAIGFSSPATEFIKLGVGMSDGIAVGVIKGADSIISAMGEVADKLANSDAVKKYAETVSKVAGSLVDVVKAFDAMANVTWLGDFGKTFDALNWLINYMVEGMEVFSSMHGEDSLKAVQVYADTAKKVSGAIVDAGKAFEAMANIVWPGDFGKTFDAINWLINYMVTGMTHFAVTHGESALKHVQTYADTAKKVAGALVDVQKAFDAINNMVFPTEFDTKLQIMHTALSKMVNSIKSMDLLLAPSAVALVQAIADRTGVAATAIGKIVDNIIAGIKHLDNLVQSNVAGSISQLLRQMLSIISATVPAAYSAGTEIGQSIGQGITDALEMSLPDFLKPAHAGGGATLVMEGGVRTVVLENGAFQVTINDTMDVEEFKFSVVQILRELTE